MTKKNTQPEKKSPPSGKLEFRQFRLIGCGCKLGELRENELPQQATQNVQLQVAVHSEGKSALVQANIKLKARYTGEPEEADPALSISANFVAAYGIIEPFFSHKHLGEYLERLGMINIWPYWREFVQSMTLRMGLPAFPVPLINVDKLKKQMAKQKAVETKTKRIASTAP
jgi:preprotein translocase subunit SecB